MTTELPTSDHRVDAKLARLHSLCICRTSPVNWADVSALLACAEVLQAAIYDGRLQSFSDREHFRDSARAALAGLVKHE